ncbi:MAG: N-acetylmuramoyl-L-alanine amidase [Elusimicrobiota bacterium]
MKSFKCAASPLMLIIFAAAASAGARASEPLSEAQSAGIAGIVSDLKTAAAESKEKITPSPADVKHGKLLVCIDPGHPSPFSRGGAIGNGATETHINWAVALKLKKILEDDGIDVMMTKSSEGHEIDNRVRVLMINEAAEKFTGENANGAALAVHLHCNSGPKKGFSIYYPDRKGRYTGVTGNEPDIGTIGPDKTIQKSSKRLAKTLHASMSSLLKGRLNDLGVMGDSKTLVGSRQGALTFSIFSKIPTVTIEMAVLSDKSDARFIKTEEGQQLMAEAIAAAFR